MMDKKFLGLNKWAWAGVAALGVVLFLYLRHKAKVAAADTGFAPLTDANATDTASLGGTPQSNDTGALQGADDSALLGDLFGLIQSSQQQLLDNLPSTTAAGLSGTTGSDSGSSGATSTGTAPTTTTFTTDAAPPVIPDGSGVVAPTDTSTPAPAPPPGNEVVVNTNTGQTTTYDTAVQTPKVLPGQIGFV